MIKQIAVGLSVFVFALALLIPVFATTYYGPSTSISPSTIAPNGTVNAVLSVVSGTTFFAPPSGGALCNPSNPSTCTFPLQSCPALSFYQINQAVVTLPDGSYFMLGSATTSGLSNPSVGRYTNSPGGPFAPAINVSSTDVLMVPFGPGVGGFTLNSNLANPPNNVNPEGPYYWWLNSGGRLDLSGVSPTATSGQYKFDLEGQVFCGSSTIFFDDSLLFTVSPPTTTTTTTTTGGATRTIGFWQTHLALEQSTWASY
ncbi:MAG: hypothetical protein JRN15_18845, partial [Nitrososphaerota archaeon]|nr:hypothetical protein [Nitrososphaerota archaeon]